MKVRHSMIISAVFVWAAMVQAQDVKAPKLKDSVALELRTLREQIANSNVQLLLLEKQYKSTQEQQAQLNGAYTGKLRTALKDSDLDETKYQLDSNTLDVKEKPVAKPQDKK